MGWQEWMHEFVVGYPPLGGEGLGINKIITSLYISTPMILREWELQYYTLTANTVEQSNGVEIYIISVIKKSKPCVNKVGNFHLNAALYATDNRDCKIIIR